MTKDVTFWGAVTALLVIASMILGGCAVIFAPVDLWFKCVLGAWYCFGLALYFVFTDGVN